jgi:5'-deoxynucleotidase YfbR-like HD superfamily hydrolase
MLSGRRLDLLDPSPIDIELEDIAHGLSRVARWNGQTVGDHGFSVAQHSLLVLELALRVKPDLSKAYQLAILLHDASEYVIGDMISPFKAVMGGNYKECEARLTNAIHIHFGLPLSLPVHIQKLMKRADKASAFLEATQLAGFSVLEATEFFGSLEEFCGEGKGIAPIIKPLPVNEAKALFITKAVSLGG